MANDVFKRTDLNWGGAFSADRGLLIPNDGLTGILMQNLGLTYSQQVSRVYEIGTQGMVTSVYYVGGRSAGNFTTSHIIGPKVTMGNFYRKFSDVCQAAKSTLGIGLQANCDGAASTPVTYRAKYCVLTQIGLGVQASDFLINDNSQVMFSNLEYSEGNQAAQAAAAVAGVANALLGGNPLGALGGVAGALAP